MGIEGTGEGEKGERGWEISGRGTATKHNVVYERKNKGTGDRQRAGRG